MQAKARLPSLTGVRGVAAIWVLFSHVQNAGRNLGLPWLQDAPVLSLGWHGVDLFFVLSGFVLMRTHDEDFRTLDWTHAKAFFKLRITRVYPLNLCVLVMIGALVWVSPGMVHEVRAFDPKAYTLWPFMKTALLITRWGLPGSGEWNEPVWSLSAEIIGYLAFPLLAWLLMRKPRFSWSIAACIASLGLLNVLQIVTHTGANNHIGVPGSLTRMAFNFAAGAALCQAFTHLPKRLAPAAPRVALVASVLIALISISQRCQWAMSDCFAILIIALASESGIVSRLFSSSVSMFLGRVSFPLYLVHLAPLFWLQSTLSGAHLPQVWGVAIVLGYLAFCIALSYLLHVAVERPCHQWGRRWAALTPKTVGLADATGLQVGAEAT